MKLYEFFERLDQIHALFIDSCTALLLLNSKINELYPNDEDLISFASGTPENAIIRQKVKVGEFKNRIQLGGQNIKVITALCIVAIYQLWEDEYRNPISIEKGVQRGELLLDIFGDLKIIRHSVIHQKSKKNQNFAKLKKLTYMNRREEVTFSDTEFHELIETIKADLANFKKQ
jgi:hypothetical protein